MKLSEKYHQALFVAFKKACLPNQAEAARKLGVKRQQVGQIIKEKDPISVGQLIDWCDTLDIDVHDILTSVKV